MIEDLQQDPDRVAHEEFVDASLMYLSAMQARYGAEEAHGLWLRLGEVLGKDVQMDVFKKMLTGDAGDHIYFRVDKSIAGQQYNKVNCIKAVRAFTMLGLKEAKDLVDASENSVQVVRRAKGATTNVSLNGAPQSYPYSREMCMRDLRANGVLIRDRSGIFC